MGIVYNKHGHQVKTFIVKQLEEEYWSIIKEIKILSGNKSNADALRWALKKATNRI